jgi:hypothetical protein
MNSGRRRKSGLWMIDATTDLTDYPVSRPVAVMPGSKILTQKGIQPMSTNTTKAPARPRDLDPKLRERAAAVTGMHGHEIVHVVDTATGLVITTKDGAVMIDVPADRPDRYGASGLLWVDRPGRIVPGRAVVWAPRDEDLPILAQITAVDLAAEPWTISDLDAQARQLTLRPGDIARGLAYCGSDPVKARGLWLRLSEQMNMSPARAALENVLCGRLHEVVAGSGYLSAEEVTRL